MRSGERTLVVVPTAAGRHDPTYAGGAALWDQVIALRPDAQTPGMRDQLICHVVFAPTKSAWYLEPRRPAIGWVATVGAGCNPGRIRDPDVG